MIGYSSINPLFFVFSFLMIGGIFSFIAAPLKIVSDIVTAGKRKATAKINAANAAKQRAHELKMAQLAQESQAGKSKQTQTMLMVGGGIAVLALIMFMKKR